MIHILTVITALAILTCQGALAGDAYTTTITGHATGPIVKETITTRDEDSPLRSLERASRGFLAEPDIPGEASVDVVIKGPRSHYWTWGLGDSFHAALKNAINQAKADLKR